PFSAAGDSLGGPRRARAVTLAGVEHFLDERIPAGHDVADPPEVGPHRDLVGAVALEDLDALRRELGAHRRIDARVRAGDAMARRAREHRDSAHEGPADAEDVEMHAAGVVRGRRARTCAGISLPLHAGNARAMARENNRKQSQMRARIAAAAARLMAEDGIDDFALAKRKAARQLGASDTQSLPANDEVETELKAYQALYQGEEQRARIRELRAVALDAMHSLVAFNPYLAGAVLKGTAGRYADIDLQLFTD